MIHTCIVYPYISLYDAVSRALRDTFRALDRASGFQTTVLAWGSEYQDLDVRPVNGLAGLLTAPEFLRADLILYHTGVYDPMFDALLIGNGRGRQIARFHNFTPPEFLVPGQRDNAARVSRQINNLRFADEIWADSETNAEVLLARDFDPAKIEVVPLTVERPARLDIRQKNTSPVHILFVGRVVPSKGVLDLIEAVARLKGMGGPAFKVSIVGNAKWSSESYIEQVIGRIRHYRLEPEVEYLATIDDQSLETLYHRANILAIPSYHEGFCMPVIEALRAGCLPVGYDAHNLPRIANGLGRMVPPGDVDRLAQALSEMVLDLANAAGHPAPIRIDRGSLTLAEIAGEVDAYLENFTFACFSCRVRERALALARPGPSKTKPDTSINPAESALA